MMDFSNAGSAAGGLFGSALEFVKMKVDQEYRSQDRRDEQNLARERFGWEQHAADTAMQRRMSDLKAAGLNPLLAGFSQGAAVPSARAGSPGAYSSSPGSAFGSGFAATSAAQVQAAQVRNVEADTEVKKATEQEIRARTPIYSAQVEKTQQETKNLAEDLKRIQATTDREASSARHLQQQVVNLQAVLPQIEAQTTLYRAYTHQALMAGGLSEVQAQEVMQRVKANLPALEAALKDLQRIRDVARQPVELEKAKADQSIQESWGASLSAAIRALTGLGTITRH